MGLAFLSEVGGAAWLPIRTWAGRPLRFPLVSGRGSPCAPSARASLMGRRWHHSRPALVRVGPSSRPSPLRRRGSSWCPPGPTLAGVAGGRALVAHPCHARFVVKAFGLRWGGLCSQSALGLVTRLRFLRLACCVSACLGTGEYQCSIRSGFATLRLGCNPLRLGFRVAATASLAASNNDVQTSIGGR